jgi:hypothetical protein
MHEAQKCGKATARTYGFCLYANNCSAPASPEGIIICLTHCHSGPYLPIFLTTKLMILENSSSHSSVNPMSFQMLLACIDSSCSAHRLAACCRREILLASLIVLEYRAHDQRNPN